MQTKYKFLLINNKFERHWPQFIQESLNDLGELAIYTEEEIQTAIADHSFDLIIIDAGTVREVTPLISSLRILKPHSRILVVTASPTWQTARDVLKAGASDYIGRSLDKGDLRSKIKAVLDLPPPRLLL